MTPDFPTQPPQTLAAGTGPPRGINFFFNDERDEGIIWRYVSWGTPPTHRAVMYTLS